MAEKRRTIGYICPKCHQCVVADRSLFSLSAGRVRIPCPCGGSALRVEYTGSGYQFHVPCGGCGGEHEAFLTQSQLMGHPILGLSCPETGLDSCYIGEEGPVYQALPRLERALDKLEEQKARPEGKESPFLDETVMAECLAELKEIAARGGVSCTCGSRAWALEVHYSSLELKCPQCGGTLRLPAATMEDLADLCCKQTLTIRGRE